MKDKPRFPFRDDYRNRWTALGIWVFSLASVTLLPFIGMDKSWNGWFALLMSVLIAFSTLIATFLVVFSFRRTMSHPLAFVVCVGLTMLFTTLSYSPEMASSQTTIAIQSTHILLQIVALDLMFAAICIAWWWGWYRRGGWILLAISPILLIWSPIMVARIASPEYAVSWLIGAMPQMIWVSVMTMLPCYAMPFGLLATLISLWKATAKELNGS